jgi:putative nucleotidyltransferase with HDIG domain
MPAFRDSFALQLRQIEKLPTLPQMLWELEAAFQNPVMGVIEIADMIEKDLSLTATLLRVSNSAFFRGNAEFLTVRDAVIRVGLAETRRLARTMLLVDALSSTGTTMDYAEFWRHGLLVAVAAEFLQEHAFKESPLLPEEAYLAGLLHDVGKLILDQYFENEYQQILAYETEHGCARAEAEMAVLGTDHGYVGAELLELWGLPPNVSEPVRWHHAPAERTDEWRASADLIEQADRLCHTRTDLPVADNDDAPAVDLSPALAAQLGQKLDQEEKLIRIITAV